jgi:ribose transport system permease protein
MRFQATQARSQAIQLTRTMASPLLVSTIVLVVLLFAGIIALPGFGAPSSINSVLVLASFLGIASVGETLVVILGGIDLSIPFVVGMTNVMVAQLAFDGLPFLLAAVVTLLAGTAIGCFNGFASARLKVHPLIITLGVGYAVQGAAEVWTNGQPMGVPPLWLAWLAATGSRIGGLPIAGVNIVWAVVAVLVVVGLRRSTLGRQIFAVGTNPVAARLALIDPVVTWTITFGVSGLLAAFAGILLLGFNGSPIATTGDSYLFLAVGAVVIGGTSMIGGRGTYVGTIIGALTIILLQTILAGIGTSLAVQELLVGLIIIMAVALFGREANVRDRV